MFMEPMKYFSIKDSLVWNNIPEDATSLDRCEQFMSYYLNNTLDEIRDIPAAELSKKYLEISEIYEKTSIPIFYPLIEIEGKLYGYVDISQMTLGEYVDLEKLCKEPQTNLAQIMAILYRPVIEHKFDTLKFKAVNSFNVASKQLTNIWDYYTLQKYNYSDSVVNTKMMELLPVSFATGALGFFLLLTSLTKPNMLAYSKANLKEKKEIMKNLKATMIKQMPKALADTGDGLLQFIIYQKLPSLTQQGINVSQISTTSSSSTGSPSKKIWHLLKEGIKNKNRILTNIK